MLQRSNVLVEISRLGRAATERMYLRSVQAVQRVELHRRERPAKFGELRRRRVQFATLVVGADDEHAHIASGSRIDARPVQVIDKVPM